MTKLGIIREGKTPPDKRVPLTPEQCKQLAQKYPELDIVVQPSNIRAFSDQRYKDAGLQMNEDLSDRDILMGVKEVPEEMLIPEKTYMFFSHTYKKQPYNRSLLQTILDKKIQLIDYEVLTDAKGRRLIGFGRYAGVVGCYNGFLATGKKLGLYNLKPAHLCEDRKEVEAELKKVKLPDGFKVVLTGKGRVSGGAIEILRFIDIDEVSPEAYLTHQGNRPVFTVLGVEDYNVKSDGSDFSKKEFYEHPERFDSNFMRFAKVSDLYVSCHYWDSNAPYIFSREDARSEDFKIRVVADISCDIDGPVASTLRPSTIADPLYGYDPVAEKETDFSDPDAIGVMAVDNLPCELPKDASEDFGDELIRHIIPELLKPESDVIYRATETNLKGELTEPYTYLRDFVEGKE